MREKCLKMIQNDPCTWQIISSKGHVLKDDIKLGLKAEAEDYIKRFVSSYNDWTYEIITLEETWKIKKL
jgi:hypothetical protein